MKFIFAPDSFKGSLSSAQCIQILTRTALQYFPECEMVGIPMADGGEGTIDAILSARSGARYRKQVLGPLGQPVLASYGLLSDGMAIIEMSAASGLTLVPEGRANPMQSSSYGTGELIRDALDRGADSLSICVGGSATNDGGMGAMAALGVRFYSRDGSELLPNVWPDLPFRLPLRSSPSQASHSSVHERDNRYHNFQPDFQLTGF